MFDYKQRPTTDEYRSGWDRIFKQPEKEEKVEDSGKQWLKPRKQKKSSGPTARSVVQLYSCNQASSSAQRVKP